LAYLPLEGLGYFNLQGHHHECAATQTEQAGCE
jgi:hypothetical protein